MTQITITVEMDNAAFVDNEDELKEVLIKIAEKTKTQASGRVRDSNGNVVANFKISDELGEPSAPWEDEHVLRNIDY